MKKIRFLLPLIAIFLFTFSSIQVSAVGMDPSKFNYSVKPGDVIEDTVYVVNSEKEPYFMALEINNVYTDNQTNQQVFTEDDVPRGLRKWITLKEEPISSKAVDPDEKIGFDYTIKVPADAEPGTYSTLFLGSTAYKAGEEPDAGGVGVASRSGIYVILTVEGNYEENLSIESFEINQTQLSKGNVDFNVKIENTGTVQIVPVGEITIYDEKNNQLKGIYAITENFEDLEVVKERKDIIPFNENLKSILPDDSYIFNVRWENRNVDAGKYKAKIVLYYGENNEKLETETDYFEILENFVLGPLVVDSSNKSSLPVSFSAELMNNGTVAVDPTGYFQITNILGAEKLRVELTPEELKVDGGEQKTLNNLIWDDGFALGLYTAKIQLDVGGKIYTQSAAFWIIAWWQALIVIVILLVIIFALYKGIHGYTVMKKKVSKLEHEEKTKE